MMKRMFGLSGGAAPNARVAANDAANPAADPMKERRLTAENGRLGTLNNLL
jgi:hypothetical protein